MQSLSTYHLSWAAQVKNKQNSNIRLHYVIHDSKGFKLCFASLHLNKIFSVATSKIYATYKNSPALGQMSPRQFHRKNKCF